jgi:chromosome partitioning protein
MRTIAIINQKGGCGKTTTSINLSACLARLGQKTLLADMDPQGHCGVGLAVPEEQIERTILDCLIEERDGKPARVPEVVWQIASDFDLCPSNIRLAGFEQMFAGRVGRDDRLKRALEMVKSNYQWCIIDCPPSVGLLTFNALRACDEVIVPVETGYFSLHGLAKMMETLELLRDKCGKDILIRVLPTLYDTRTKLAREVLSELRGKFKEYLMESTVNFNTKLKEAASFGQPITEYDPGSRGYKDFVNLARELMGHRPAEVEATPMEKMSRPAELVHRAKQLAQLTNYQFGRTSVPTPSAAPAPAAPTISPVPMSQPAAMPQPVSMPIASPMLTPSSAMREPQVTGGSTALMTAPARPATTGTLPMASALLPKGAISVSPTAASLSGQLTMGTPLTEPAPLNLAMPVAKSEAETVFARPDVIFRPETIAKTTAQKIEEFYGVKQIGDEVLFSARFEKARKVLIAGDFNNWMPMSTPMLCAKPGEWKMRLPLQPGRYRYRFVVDGKWITDPHNTYVEANQFGELNNVVEVD